MIIRVSGQSWKFTVYSVWDKPGIKHFLIVAHLISMQGVKCWEQLQHCFIYSLDLTGQKSARLNNREFSHDGLNFFQKAETSNGIEQGPSPILKSLVKGLNITFKINLLLLLIKTSLTHRIYKRVFTRIFTIFWTGISPRTRGQLADRSPIAKSLLTICHLL